MSQIERYRVGMVRFDTVHDGEREGCEYEDDDGCPRVVALPHSCDSWRIGGPDEVRALIADLIDALNQMEPHATMPQTEAGFRGREKPTGESA